MLYSTEGVDVMRILAIETALIGGSVAALENETLLSEIPLDPERRTTRSLTPAMHDLLQQVGWRSTDVECIGVSIGPGSFTGLRIGVTAAKAFAYATGAAVSGVITLHTLAAQIPIFQGSLWAVMNAERSQVYASRFESQTGEWIETSPPQIIDAAPLFESLTAGTQITGPALREFSAILPRQASLVDEKLWTPRAATVGQLAFRKIQAGQQDDLWSLVPFYLRDSAAREKILLKPDAPAKEL